jgi:hypothetical protein
MEQLDLFENQKNHIAQYNGKEVNMNYAECKDMKEEFKRACMRIVDNAQEGIVICPNGKRYFISRSSRKAKLIEEAKA